MSRLDAAPEVRALAKELGVRGAAPVAGILNFCRSRIDRWVADAGGVNSIAGLESLVTQRLQMTFEEIRTDEDFDRLTQVYARGKKEFVFAGMRTKFDDADNPTYGALVQCRNARASSPDRFVAVIDCRGSKLARRFFTRWHEIAHRLTTHADMPEPVYRSERDPIERLMDEIAGQFAFYGPLFDPVFKMAYKRKKLLSFETVEAVVRNGFPEASFQATLHACTRNLPTPVIYLEAAVAHKAATKRQIEDSSTRLFPVEEPLPELRAVCAAVNEAARAEKFLIPQNMRVPVSSVIRSLFEADGLRDATNREDLGHWSDSKGNRLESRAVAVEARKVPDRVIAIVQPVKPVRKKRAQSQAVSRFSE